MLMRTISGRQWQRIGYGSALRALQRPSTRGKRCPHRRQKNVPCRACYNAVPTHQMCSSPVGTFRPVVPSSPLPQAPSGCLLCHLCLPSRLGRHHLARQPCPVQACLRLVWELSSTCQGQPRSVVLDPRRQFYHARQVYSIRSHSPRSQ